MKINQALITDHAIFPPCEEDDDRQVNVFWRDGRVHMLYDRPPHCQSFTPGRAAEVGKVLIQLAAINSWNGIETKGDDNE